MAVGFGRPPLRIIKSKTRIIEGFNMLQKLLIAFCTILALSACGGSIDLGPNQTPPPANGGGGGGPGPEPEPEEPRIFNFIPFSEEADVSGWSSRCVGTCNATAALSWNSG